MRTGAPRHKTTRALGCTGAMVTLCVGLVAAPAHGQVLIGMLFGGALASENFNIGFEIGMNLSNVDGLNGGSLTRGTLLGLYSSWRFSEHFHLYSAILPLSGKGAKDADPIALNDPTLDPIVGAGKMTRQLGYFDIPVVVQFAPRKSDGFRIGAGAQMGILTSAKDRYEGLTPEGTSVTVENDIEGAMQRFDAGLALDTEYRFAKIPLAIGVRYYYGMTDTMKGSGPAVYNRVLSGSGRIALGVSRKKPPESKQ